MGVRTPRIWRSRGGTPYGCEDSADLAEQGPDMGVTPRIWRSRAGTVGTDKRHREPLRVMRDIVHVRPESGRDLHFVVNLKVASMRNRPCRSMRSSIHQRRKVILSGSFGGFGGAPILMAHLADFHQSAADLADDQGWNPLWV